MKTRKWNEVRRGSKVILKKSFSFIGLLGTERTLEPGEYWINGFWGDACGLAFSKQEYKDEFNHLIIPSRSLINFEGIMDGEA